MVSKYLAPYFYLMKMWQTRQIHACYCSRHWELRANFARLGWKCWCLDGLVGESKTRLFLCTMSTVPPWAGRGWEIEIEWSNIRQPVRKAWSRTLDYPLWRRLARMYGVLLRGWISSLSSRSIVVVGCDSQSSRCSHVKELETKPTTLLPRNSRNHPSVPRLRR